MFTVSLVGPDGCGKSLVSKMLAQRMPELPLKRVYMGINLESSNFMLPTTKMLLKMKMAGGGKPDMAGPFDPSRTKESPKGPVKRLLSEIKAWVLLANRVAEEWFRQGIAWVYLKRGYNVIFDRHFVLDYYFYDMEYTDRRKPLTRRIHGFLLKKFYPRPDLVIYMDAPAELLYRRKGEGTLEQIEQRRKEYLGLREVVPAFSVVDASLPQEQVVEQVSEIVRTFAQTRAGLQEMAGTKPSGQWS